MIEDRNGLISKSEFQKAFQGKRKDTLLPLLSRVEGMPPGAKWNDIYKCMDVITATMAVVTTDTASVGRKMAVGALTFPSLISTL